MDEKHLCVYMRAGGGSHKLVLKYCVGPDPSASLLLLAFGCTRALIGPMAPPSPQDNCPKATCDVSICLVGPTVDTILVPISHGRPPLGMIVLPLPK